MVLTAIKKDAGREMAVGQGTILMTDARYDKHVNAAPLDIIADLGSRRPRESGRAVGVKVREVSSGLFSCDFVFSEHFREKSLKTALHCI
jgi:hypothetical protein